MKNVVIVGRPNVGKSTLFNKLIGRKKSITHEKEGTTRDLISFDFGNWCLIDSGGIDFEAKGLKELVKKQVFYAIEDAKLILFVIDGNESITPLDEEIGRLLRKNDKEVFVIWNKIDKKEAEENFYRVYELGFKKVFKVSAEHSVGISLLKEEIEKFLKVDRDIEREENIPKISIIGKPNVGKSSLLNAILGKERLIVSPIPGTTRDSVDVMVKYYGKKYIFIDTAGLRRKTKISGEEEFLSFLKAKKSIERSDIVLFVLDVTKEISNQERDIAFEVEKNFKGMVFVGNKSDLINEKEKEAFKEKLYSYFPYFSYIPFVFVSALKKKNMDKIWKKINLIQEGLNYRISTGILNRIFREALERYPEKRRKFYFITQPEVNPPTFVLVGNSNKKVKESFIRYIQGEIRKIYPFTGVPLKIIIKRR